MVSGIEVFDPIFLKEIESVWKGGRRCRMGLFKCYCGTEFEAYIDHVKRKKTIRCKNCRKIAIKNRNITHGYTRKGKRIPEYGVWAGVLRRCRDLNNDTYGGRGIGICKKWEDSFEAFLNDMGRRPSKDHSLDRHPNNDGNYEPGNCRWATREEQALNRRSSVLVQYNNEIKPLMTWCKTLNLPYEAIRSRIVVRKWSPEKAFTHPLRENGDMNIEYMGRTQNLMDWCKELKLNYEKMRQRIKYHNYTPTNAFEKQ